MKKVIRIMYLMILILLAFGFTTSDAVHPNPTIDTKAEKYTVKTSTTPKQMLDALAAGKTLTGIYAYVKDDNKSLLCREPNVGIYGSAIYDSAGEPTFFPGTEKNGYKKAYILAAPGYTKTERQNAWHGKSNDLNKIASDYQTYKTTEEKDVIATVDPNAEAEIIGDISVYGPIKIEYSYKKSKKGDRSDEWGGFNYAFFDYNNSNVSDRVSLCTLEKGEYKPITSTEITSDDESNGYYKVRDTKYNNVELYVITSDKTVGAVSLKIQENKVNYTATIYPIKGEQYLQYPSTVFCYDCGSQVGTLTTDMATAMSSGYTLTVNGSYYNYTGTTTETKYWRKGQNTPQHVYRVGGTDYNAGVSTTSTSAKYCDACDNYGCTKFHSNYNYCGACNSSSQRYTCSKCGHPSCYGNTTDAVDHNNTHKKDARKYTINVYNFSKIGCGVDRGEKSAKCGSWADAGYCKSQGLDIIETTAENKSNEIKLDLEIRFSINLRVEKVWEDDDNKYENRPESITVELVIDGENSGQTRELNQSNNWKNVFEDLDIVDDNGKRYTYTIREISQPLAYTTIQPTGDYRTGIVITNSLERTNIPVQKIWNDDSNRDGVRPSTVTVTLYRDGVKIDEVQFGGEGDVWNYTFANLPKYVNKKLVTYNIEETVIPEGYIYEKTGNEINGFTITNTHYGGYIEITGKVWLDRSDGKANQINGAIDDDELGLGGIKVTLRDEKGNQFDATSTTTTNSDGTYTIRVNYDNSKNVYKLYDDVIKVRTKLNTSYIEFEYDAMKFTTVAPATSGVNTSKVKEDESTRNRFDNAHPLVTTSTTHPDYWDTTITAVTKGVISFEDYTDKTYFDRDEIVEYCTGKTIEQTDLNRAWEDIIIINQPCGSCDGTGHTMTTSKIKVEYMPNVNLGLFEREQPKIGIFSDLSKVEVEMNKQKYTYLYGVRSKDFADAEIKAQFQNKDEYKYERPINPADISFIQEPANSDAMSVFVTYEIEVGNLSSTLPITVNNIINVYDLNYKNPKITLDGKDITYTISSIYGTKEERGFNEITLNDLNITILPGQRSSKIVIRYEVEKERIRSIFEGDAALHNAVEIHTYSTTYGESTLYAEQRTGERTGNAYGGYDYDAHPGNAAIKKEAVTYIDKENNPYQAEILKSTENLVEYVAGRFGPERDTDISPSFILCKDSYNNSKTLAGTVFEDTDAITTDSERLGDGKYDSAVEKTVQNVKVELYRIIRDDDNNITGVELAKLYKKPEEGANQVVTEDAKIYTDENGNYAFKGVVTGEYFLKFTYGNDTEELEYATTMDGGRTAINARNHKSTIITNPLIKEIFGLDYEDVDFDKKWHINIEDNYSVAVDNMIDRLKIEDLQNNNFDSGENMTAYSKPFMTQVEFESTGESQAKANGEMTDSNGNGVSSTLNKLDFGIIERPREDIFLQKRVTYLKITLANGQILTEGNPNTQTLNYVKSMGQGHIFDSSESRDFERRLLVEMDTELIQGSRLETEYEVIARNNNEIDYDYGTKEDYGDIIDTIDTSEYDKYITRSPKANYYYYGESSGLEEMKATIEIVDYMSKDVLRDESDGIWTEISSRDLKTKGLISDDTEDFLEKSQDYRVFIPTANEGKITLGIGEFSEKFTMSGSKILANKDENIYDNHTEIIKIDGKSARTISESEAGKQLKKLYTPGDYVPGIEDTQQDDDRVSLILTNATGITNYIITYLITGLIGLIVLVIGVVIIKKALTKKHF